MSILGKDVANDLELFVSYAHTEEGTLLETVSSFARTPETKRLVRNILERPSADRVRIEGFQQRIAAIKALDTGRLTKLTDDVIAHIEEPEWILRNLAEGADTETTGEHVFDPKEALLFQLSVLRAMGMNDRTTCLNVLYYYTTIGAPISSVVTPFLYATVPFLVVMLKLKIRIPVRQFVQLLSQAVWTLYTQSSGLAKIQWLSLSASLFFYLKGIVGTFQISYHTRRVADMLYNHMDGFRTFLRSSIALLDAVLPNYDPSFHENALSTFWAISRANVGATVYAFRTAMSPEHEWMKLYRVVHSALADVSIAQYVLRKNLCRVEFVDETEGTVLRMKDMTHPCIDDGVPNDADMTRSHLVITGPNAAGKSTYIKAIVSNIVLSQTIGFAHASRIHMSPFSSIHTQINIPDCKGDESLFQAEMRRCKIALNLMRERSSATDRVLLVFDEIFNSTNVVEGVAGAYAVLNKLASYDNARILLTTHYPYLTKLSNFKRVKMVAHVNDAGDIEYPYRIKEGISRQYIALELLREEDFDPDVIEHAIQIKTKLLRNINKEAVQKEG
jgi:hypothetical protein